ncbi:hypothetical protein EW146_g9249 [Bondarzewia mesenterica]|uniref:Reverse transcriptase domain-containing protein n=1 Tax=Bondarzewia mesenterica TaxID=1095465 RepID=A0A4S4L7T3_9AGAM|nr:hypothetical protein EW146_g9249 [Bondarzewia mesenterica]
MVIFFGLTNSPATFQAMMNMLFQDLIDEAHVIIYMDNILIFTDNLEQHRCILHRILRTLQENDLFLKPEKCTFETPKVEYLEVIVSYGTVEMDPIKVNGITKWPVPTKVKEVQSFLGFGNFYRWFIKDYSKVARLLFDLTQKMRN